MSLNHYILISFVSMELFNFIAIILHIQAFIPEEYFFEVLKPMTTQ